MNPYAISGRRLSHVRKDASAKTSSAWSFVQSIFNAEISSVTAIAFVLFAATSVGALTMVAQTELSGSSDGIFAGAFNTAHAQPPQVLGLATYGYNQPVCGYNTANCLNYQLIGFSGNGWQVKIDYQLQGNITGAIKVNSWPFMDGITGSGSGYTGNDLLPNQTYTFVLYKKIGSRLQQLTSLAITAPAKSQTYQPVCPSQVVPQSGCYYDNSNKCGGNLVCPTPPPSYGYTTPHYGQGSNSLIEGWLESMSSYSATAPGSAMVSGWAYNNGGKLNINIKLVNSTTGVSYPAAVTTPVPSYRQDVASYITQIVGSAPNGLNGMFTATVGNLPTGTYYIVATFGDGYSFNVLGQVPATITINPVPAAGLLKILSPNGGEKFVTGSNLNIQWTGDDPSYLIHLYLIPCANSSVSSCGNGLYNLGSNEPNNGSFNWTVQANDAYGHTIPSGYYQAWIQDNRSISDDKSDAPFVITQSTSPIQPITITGPSSNFNTAAVGQPYSAVFTISPSNVEYTMTSDANLPPGLSLSQNPIPACLVGAACPAYYHNAYTLSGVPIQVGTYTFQLKAVAANGNIGTNTFTITVNPGSTGTSGVRAGQLVFKADKTVYLVGSNVLYPIPSVAVFNSWGWTFSNVLSANSIEAALPISNTWVPSRNLNCSDAISQINGTCGSSQSTISVTIPAGGEQWAVGSTHIVTWVPNSSASPTVNIELVSSTDCTAAMISACTNYQVIASNVPNNGSYAWTIASPTFGTMGVSNYYKVAVSYPVNNCTASNGGTICTYAVGGTSGAFTIISAASSTSIKILSPAGGEQWALGSIHMITWDASTTGGYPLNIVLTGTSGNYSLTTTAPNTGSYSWTISNNLSVGSYTLTISGPQMCTNSYPTHCYGAPGTSQSFSLVNPTNSVVNINSLNPVSGPVGTAVTITGSGFASTGNNVSMRSYLVAGNLTSGDGKTLQFTVPATLAPNCAVGTACPQYIVSVTPGDYSVVVTNANGTSTAQIFSVTSGTSISARVGQLVYKTDKTVYLVGQSVLYPIPSVAVFNSWGWSFSNVLPANSAEATLPVSGTWVPSRNPACADAVSQTNGACSSSSLPDLQIVSITPSGDVIQNQTTTYTATVKNSGSVSASSFVVNLGGTAGTISSLAPGATATVTANFGLTLLGSNQVCARVDIRNSVSESNESNNDFCQNVNVVTASTGNHLPSSPVMSLGPVNNTVTVGANQQFNFMSTDADGDSLTYKVNWGDTSVDVGNAASGVPFGVLHTWTAVGNYTITVSVTDNKGGLAVTSTFPITVVSGTSSSVRVGQLAFINGGTVYLVGSKGLYGIPDIATFNSWGWSFSQVVAANSAEQALSQIGMVPMKHSGCSSALDQINGTCNTITALPDYTVSLGFGNMSTITAGSMSVTQGQTTEFKFTVTNLGAAAYVPGIEAVYNGQTPTGLNNNISDNSCSSQVWLGTNQSCTYAFSGVYNQTGATSITVNIDPHQTLQESNENNNSVLLPIYVTSSQSNSGPVISSFTANQPSITLGQSSTLSWQVSSGAIINIDNGVGTVSNKTSISVSPTQTITYTLTAYFGGTDGPNPTAAKSLTVTVAPQANSSRMGQIINNNGTVQLVGKSGLYGFPNITVFNSWGFSFANVVTANAAEQALSQIGVVPSKQASCSSPLSQIAGTCLGP